MTKKSGQERKAPRKAQERLDGRVAAFKRDHAPENERTPKPSYTRPGSRKR